MRFEFSHHLSHIGNVGRIIRFAAIRHRSQVGAVRFDQHAVERDKLGHLAQVCRCLKRQNAGKRDVKAGVQRGTCNRQGFGKAMEHAACTITTRSALAFLVQDRQRIAGGVSGVDDQRKAGLAGSTNMHPKSVALPCHVCNSALAQPEIVKPGFSDTHDLGQSRAPYQVVNRGLGHALVVRMHTDAGPKIVVSGGQRMDVFKLLKRGANAQSPIDFCVMHSLAYLWKLVPEFGSIQMAVGISKHKQGMQPESTMENRCGAVQMDVISYRKSSIQRGCQSGS